jgi:methylenetetrahydrofolate--tRNA-(uracil-5-)-methyltransferase
MKVHIIGGGLAGSEAAWQVAERGVDAVLHEMRPVRMTPAHRSGLLAELVCSNSLGSGLHDRPTGVLREELMRLGSLLVRCADEAQVPAGGAVAVDRDRFAQAVTVALDEHPRIQVERGEVTEIPADGPVILASGPLTSDALAETIQEWTGSGFLQFFDAMAPIVEADSLNMEICFRASRRGVGQSELGDYLNCPMNKDEYHRFVEGLVSAEQVSLPEFEHAGKKKFFEGCLPVEELARRGVRTLAFGPLRPIGLDDPRTGRWPHAVVQLRQENAAANLYNMVGFQTNLKYGEQDRVFRLIPGLENAEFVRYGQMHRNTYVNAPALLDDFLRLKSEPRLFFAGQLAGVEGYLGSVATGLMSGVNAVQSMSGKDCVKPPGTSMLGALMHYLCQAEVKNFQPMKANFGLLPALAEKERDKRLRYRKLADRALVDLSAWWMSLEGGSRRPLQ